MYETWGATVARLIALRVPQQEITGAMRAATYSGQAFAERLDGSGIRVRYSVERAPIAGPTVKFQVREVTP